MFLSYRNRRKFYRALSKINPYRIYIENIRALMGVDRKEAVFLTEMAVADGTLVKRYSVECPDPACGIVIATYDSLEDIPQEIPCELCIDEHRNHQNPYAKEACEIVPFYIHAPLINEKAKDKDFA